ncbi:hypothetical protein B6U70_01140 [Euryarchaeota archaeon ex4484_162]|nr:MAG: hypothetical protein FE038_02165 [Thermoplasmata archaeon]MCD6108365.1 hypothetical protein [Thermoplasmata archaeon]OYT58159.1 MAG: hypothetical protein B6U70_01140 [Euryarchaeota archaeon ex4484_162]RLF62117.1 MAG: hypothetical protein DRN16_02445 [Thermoplasmata archaeon]
MWLVIVSFAAAIVTALWYAIDDDGKYKLSFLSLVLWGTTIMVFVDHLIGYLAEGGGFLEITGDAALLGIVLIIVALVIWEIVLLVYDPKRKLLNIKTH